MTPEQANIAAAVLELHAPAHALVECGMAVDLLRRCGTDETYTWLFYETGDLSASDPGGRSLSFPNPSAFAKVVCAVWSQPECPVPIDYADREAAKSQRWRLAKRLEQRGLVVLAQAVRDIKLRSIGGEVVATYSPQAVPIRIEK